MLFMPVFLSIRDCVFDYLLSTTTYVDKTMNWFRDVELTWMGALNDYQIEI